MAWAWLDHFDHTAYMSFQFVGFSSSLNVALCFRCPHLLQVSIKANPFVLFLVCLHLFVYLLSYPLWNPSALYSLSLFPLSCFLRALLSTQAALLHPCLHQRPVLLLGPRSVLASFRERKWSVRKCFYQQVIWYDVRLWKPQCERCAVFSQTMGNCSVKSPFSAESEL